MNIPPQTQHYLDQCESLKQKHKIVVTFFHRWMKQQNLLFADLQPRHLDQFLDYLLHTRTINGLKICFQCYLVEYLIWLRKKKYIQFNPNYLKHHVHQDLALPPLTQSFLASLTHLKASSLPMYKSCLRCFYEWLNNKRYRIQNLTRNRMVGYFQFLQQKKLKPSTRAYKLAQTRIYLAWLKEQGVLHERPDELIRNTDFPALPSLLPRPLPPEVDKELQSRFAQSKNVYHQGFLLMRHTGIRIGELIDLEYHCVHTDHNSNHFLKVPLGKLNNERLVPLNESAYQLITKLQGSGNQNRQNLLVNRLKRKTTYGAYCYALEKICKDLECPDRITSHRLRHTFASTLLGGGMSLAGVKQLLGHHSFRTTLIYAAVTPTMITKEYFRAIANIEKEYSEIKFNSFQNEADPIKMLSDVASWIKKSLQSDGPNKKLVKSALKRISLIQEQLHQLKKKTVK